MDDAAGFDRGRHDHGPSAFGRHACRLCRPAATRRHAETRASRRQAGSAGSKSNRNPGYWRRDDLTSDVFDEEGLLRTGDALDWVDPGNWQAGFRYGGRLAEDFKLPTGTWVRVGALRAHLLQHLTPELRDVVIAGENRDYIAVLGIPSAPTIADDKAVRSRLRAKLTALKAEASGSAQRVLRFAFLTEKLSIDTAELTDKGVVSQRNILRRHVALID